MKHRRRLIIEGKVLQRYAMGQDPCGSDLRTYVRIIEKIRSGQSLDIVHIARFCPLLLALVDFPPVLRKVSPELHWRLDAAFLIAESTMGGASKCLSYHERIGNKFRAYGGLIGVVFAEGLLMVFRLFAIPLILILLLKGRFR